MSPWIGFNWLGTGASGRLFWTWKLRACSKFLDQRSDNQEFASCS